MIPQPVLSAIPSSLYPVAYLTIDGLGVCSFNRELVWEVAFIRPGHDFRVEVSQEEITGPGTGRVISNGTHYVPEERERLELVVENGSQAHYDIYPKGAFTLDGAFSRESANSNDFRWVIDFVGRELEVRHGRFVRLKRKNELGRVPVTVATIPNSLFYTDSVSRDAVILAPDDGTDPNAGGGTVLGRTSEQIGAVILANPPGTLRLIGADGDIELPYSRGHVYQISLTNMDDRKLRERQAGVQNITYVRGDFSHYYDIIEVNGQHYELWAPVRSNEARTGDCHAVTAGDPPVTRLMPLIE
jgi:hypothetical protein